MEEIASTLERLKSRKAIKLDRWEKNNFETELMQLEEELKNEQDENEKERLEKEIKLIQDQKEELESLINKISLLQNIYNQATKNLIVIISEIDKITALKTETKKELEDAEKFMGKLKESNDEESWVTVKIKEIKKKKASLNCDRKERSRKPEDPNENYPIEPVE